MVEVRAVKDAYVLADTSDATPIPGDRWSHVELTPHIARAVREGDLERRPEQPAAQDVGEPKTRAKKKRPAKKRPAKKRPARQAAKKSRKQATKKRPAPQATSPAKSSVPKRNPGQRPSDDWTKIAAHFDKEKPFPSLGRARDAVKGFLTEKELSLMHDRTIERWIMKNRSHWIRGA